MTEQAPYVDYQMSVPATWSPTFETRPVTVYGSRSGELPEVVAKGTCRLRKHGEPSDIRIFGFKPDPDWAKLNTGMGPGEWVTDALLDS